MEILWAVGLTAWLLSIWACVYIADQKGRSPALGLTLGILFGVLGWFAMLLLPSVKKRARIVPSSTRYDWNESEEAAGRYLGIPDPKLERMPDPTSDWEISGIDV